MIKVTGRLKNYSRHEAKNVHLQVRAPQGWKINAVSPSHFGRIANNPARPTRLSWKITAPRRAEPGSSAQLQFEIHYQYGGKPQSLQKQIKLTIQAREE
jgi:uncharacterized membrane protein